jgi:DNA-directed RNA polymerase specialized sigma24 family protein
MLLTLKSPNATFPITRHSAIIATRSSDRQERVRAYETILSAYWKPSYKYIRLKWQATRDDAEDLTQGFFAKAFEKGYFERYDHTIGSFHAFLRVCIDRFVGKEKQAQGRQKRGGETFFVPLDFSGVEEEFNAQALANQVSLEEYFHQEWVRSLFTLSIETLTQQARSRGKEVHLQLFELYDLEDQSERPTYEMLARRFGLKTTDVTNYLASARREFRKIILDKLREMTATDEEFRREARLLFGVDL